MIALAWVACRHAAVPEPPTANLGTALSGEARAFYLRARAAESRGDPAEVERSADWVIRLDRANPWAWIHASELYLAAGRPPLAQNAALEAVMRAPALPEAHRALGLARLAAGDAEGALDALARGGPGLEATLIRADLARGDAASATARLVGWTPTGSRDRLERAALTGELGRPDIARDEAIALVDDPVVGPDALQLALDTGLDACDLRPLHPVAVERAGLGGDPRWGVPLGAIAVATGDEALEARVVRLAADPVGLAAWQLAQGHAEEALQTLGDQGPPEIRGRVLQAVGRREEAAAAFADVPAPLGLALRAELLLAEGHADEAVATTEVWTHDPAVAQVRARALVVAGRVDEAVELVPDDGWRILALAGRAEEAQAALLEAADGSCAVEAWIALAEKSPPCDAAGLLERAAAVRIGDGSLATAIGRDRAACAEIQVPR